MFIFTFLVMIALCQFATNKILGISDDNSVGYSYSKRDSLIILGFFLIGLLLQSLHLSRKPFWITCGVYATLIIMTMVILATIKKVIIEKQREELQKIFDVLSPVLPKNAELDMNNPPFKLGYDKNQVNRITIEINPNTFKETVAVNLCLSLNKFLPNYEWVNEFDFASRECAFVGTPLPPNIAKYKGSWMRPAEFIPIGLSGLGEVSWNINSFKNEGRSNYIYEDGKIAKTVDTPSAPQALCVGSPLGLDTIIPTTNGYKTMGTIEVGDYVFGYNNTPVEVVEVHNIITKPKSVYKLVFGHGFDCIEVISDEIHRFPKIKYTPTTFEDDKYFEPIHCKDLQEGNTIIGHNRDYSLFEKKKLLFKKPVRCITVNSDYHIFMITDKKNPNWIGGNNYCYPAIYTYNTGGGKAIYINQDVEILS